MSGPGKLHHLAVGCADASVISVGTTFLVDCCGIEKFEHLLPRSKAIRGVVITHQHTDHFGGLNFLRKQGYSIEYLIYSPYVRRRDDPTVTSDEWEEFADHRDYFAAKGTGCYAPYRQDDWTCPFWEIDGLRFWILGPDKQLATAECRDLHDACLVVGVQMGARRCVFTGDASDASLNLVARMRDFCDDILHASHHGSINGADLAFIKACRAQYTVVSTEAGVYDSVPHTEAMERYRTHTAQRVYRTDEDGSISWDLNL